MVPGVSAICLFTASKAHYGGMDAPPTSPHLLYFLVGCWPVPSEFPRWHWIVQNPSRIDFGNRSEPSHFKLKNPALAGIGTSRGNHRCDHFVSRIEPGEWVGSGSNAFMSDRTRDRLRKAVERHREILAEAKSRMTDLILTELKVGLQFAEFARDSFLTKSNSAARRQQDCAVRAYQAVEKFLPRSAPTSEQRTLIEKQLIELKAAISDLENLSKETAD